MLKLHNVSKKYSTPAGEKWALKGFSACFPSKGLIAIVGQSGSGKSTLLNLIGSLETLTTGSLSFAKENLGSASRKKREDYRSFECSFVYQHFNLLDDLSTLDNVMLPLLIRGEKYKNAKQKAIRVLDNLKMSDKKDSNVSFLSGGEKERVGVARALVSEPRVILADEPTGALDEENGRLVMATLKKASQKSLVLLVSHNEALVKEYAERCLRLEDGRLISDTGPSKIDLPCPVTHKRGPNRKIVFSMAFRGFKGGSLRMVLDGLSSFAFFVFILVGFGFVVGSEDLNERSSSESLQYATATITQTEVREIVDSPLSIETSKRPDKEEIATLLEGINYHLAPDYSYYLSSTEAFSLNAFPEDPASFVPLYDMTLSNREDNFIVAGEALTGESLSYLLVNEAFAEKHPSALGETLRLEKRVSVSRNEASDEVYFSISSLIVGIVKEFSFLSSPRVFYSFRAFESLLDGISLPEISEKEGAEVSARRLVELVGSDDSISSYGYRLFPEREGDMKALEAKSKTLEKAKSPFKISSMPYNVNEVYTALVQAFSLSLTPFGVMSLASAVLTIGFFAYSSFLKRKKELAVLSALGTRSDDLLFIAALPSVVSSLAGAVLSLIVTPFLAVGFNSIIQKRMGIAGLIQISYGSVFSIPGFLIMMVILISLLVSSLASSVALGKALRVSLVEELRDE